MRARPIRSAFRRLCTPDWLEEACDRCCRGKRGRPDIAWFLFERERNLAELRDRIVDGTWRHDRFRLLLIRDPKPRVIARATVRDRVLHSAVAGLLEPALLRSAAPTDFACRPGFGQHRAVLWLLRELRRYRFVLHLDIRSYFPSIDTSILFRLLERRVHDPDFLEIVARLFDAGRGLYDGPLARRHARLSEDWPPRGQGLPMGAVTSQLFAAHLYLTELDHLLNRGQPGSRSVGLRCLRYVDDFFLFADSRAQLREARAWVAEWLWAERRLLLKHPSARVLSCRGHLDGLGFRIRRTGVEPLPKALRRVASRVSAQGRDPRIGLARIQRSVAASAGHLFTL